MKPAAEYAGKGQHIKDREVISLNGLWKFRLDPDCLGEKFPEDVHRGFREDTRLMDRNQDDRNWDEIEVPSCWQVHGYHYNGTAWYRRKFELSSIIGKRNILIEFMGIDYIADVWVNGYYLGTHEGYFNHFKYDVTRYVHEGQNALSVRVESPSDVSLKISEPNRCRRKKLIKGALYDWDCNNLEINPGGIWNDVNLLLTDYCRIDRVAVWPYIDFRGRTVISAYLNIQVDLFNASNALQEAVVDIKANPLNFNGQDSLLRKKILLSPGLSRRDILLEVNDPQLWWPVDFGSPCLYFIAITVRGCDFSDTRTIRTGLREIKLGDDGGIYVNRERVFIRGTNYLSDQLLSQVNRKRYEEDIDLVINANMNAIRTFANVEKDDFYDLCDQHGILVYQDFPLQWRYANDSELVNRASQQVKSMIFQLSHHPSIYQWSFGSEPSKANFVKLCAALANEAKKFDPTRLVNQANYTHTLWGGDLDLKKWAKKHSWIIDNHFYQGWYGKSLGSMENLKEIDLDFMPVVSEYGAQALPCVKSLKDIFPQEDIWPPNWISYAKKCFQKEEMSLWSKEPHSINEFINRTQAYQAKLLKYHTEFYRRHKFQPVNAIFQFLLKDCWPAITWSVVDYFNQRKAGYHVLAKAFSPVHIMVDWSVERLEPGKLLAKTIYVINDTLKSLGNVTWIWRLEDPEGRATARGEGASKVPPNSVVQVGEVKWHIPSSVLCGGWMLRIELKSGCKVIADNEYSLGGDDVNMSKT